MPQTAAPGSVYQRQDGYWVASVSVAKKRIVRYAPTERAARRLLQELQRQYHLGTLAAPTRVTLAEWVGQWLERVSIDLRPSTARTYRQTVTPVVEPIGHLRLDRLTPHILADTFATLKRKGMGARRLQLAHGYLRAALAEAVALEMIGTNPMAKVPRPKWEPRERTYWTVEEAGRFIETAMGSKSKWAPLFVLLTTAGLRVSEALGLTWADVDLRNRTVRIERALVWAGREPTLGPVKTKAARRTVCLPEVAMIALERMPRPIDPTRPVFLTERDRPPHPDHLRDPMGDLCRRAGVPRINIHGTRHVAAALALHVAGDPYAVMRRLGHKNVGVTVGVYGYGLQGDADVAAALGALLDAQAVGE